MQRPEISREWIARNQAIRRRINGAIRAARDAGAHAFLCECGTLGCNSLVKLDIDAYDDVRAHEDRFVVRADHVVAEVDRPVASLPSGAVVVEVVT
jgi:hypothetical protein